MNQCPVHFIQHGKLVRKQSRKLRVSGHLSGAAGSQHWYSLDDRLCLCSNHSLCVGQSPQCAESQPGMGTHPGASGLAPHPHSLSLATGMCSVDSASAAPLLSPPEGLMALSATAPYMSAASSSPVRGHPVQPLCPSNCTPLISSRPLPQAVGTEC